jgi:glycerol kinase
LILALDQGTTGTTCLLVDEELTVHERRYVELPQHFPQPGWVEHDPEAIWRGVREAMDGLAFDTIAITNQRETTVVWDRRTGEPVANAIVWQDRRTAARCDELDADFIRARTGLVPDPYFSATKLEWLLQRHDGDLAFGTVDSWLVWKLTGGAVHATDETNASRTMLCSLQTLDWDDDLLALFGIPREVLPEIRASGAEFGERIRGIAGTSRRRCSLRAARRRRRTARGPSCSSRPRMPPGTACCARLRLDCRGSRRGARSKAPCS